MGNVMSRAAHYIPHDLSPRNDHAVPMLLMFTDKPPHSRMMRAGFCVSTYNMDM